MLNEFKVNHIIVPTDFSETAYVAIDHAVELANKFGSSITLLHVLESGAYSGMFAPSSKTEYVELEQAQEKLQEEGAKLEKETGISVSQKVGNGRIYDEVVEAIREYDADLVVMGTHGSSGWAEFFLGSNAFRVVTQSPVPVITIQPGITKAGFKNIILPIDDSAETRQKVRYAAALAKKYGSTIHVGALLTDDEKEVHFKFEIIIKQIAEYLDRENIAHTKTILTGSNLATMTMNFSETKKGDLIAIMTEQEGDLTGFLMGPVAQQIVNHSKIPVLSISPEEGAGFTLN
ncbi:universal stress protein [Bacteroidota bacterium]